MKRFFALAALVLGLASCQTEPEGLNVNTGGEVDTFVTVSLPETTRANSAVGAFTNLDLEGSNLTIRYIFQVFYDGNPSLAKHVIYSDDNSVSFPVRLVPNRHYNFVAWADVVSLPANTEMNKVVDYSAEATPDYHYNTANLQNVTINNDTWVAMDETRDAYTGFYNTADKGDAYKYTGSSSINIPMTRPFAKLRVLTTDMQDLKNLDLEPRKADVNYGTEHYLSFNACSGTPFNKATELKSHTIEDVRTYGESGTLFVDYFFASSTEDETVRFDLLVYDQKGNAEVNKIKYNNFNTDIKVRRNYLTTISGNILTDGNNVKVTVDDVFKNSQNPNDKPYYNEIVEVGNATDLQEAINESTEETTIVLGGNINLGDLLSAGILSTRAAATLPIVIAEGKVVALDLNGFNLTTPFVEGSTTNHTYAFENHGSLTIQDSKGNGQIIARGIFNYGTMTLKSGTINACDGNGGYGVRNYEGAEFIMNGGSIVTSNEDGDKPGVGYDASPVRVDEGATATINGGAINNVSNFTVAIDNYGTTTINDGTFTTIHTTIANSASMTINGGSFTCNGLEGVTAHALWAAAGTTTINGGTFDGKDNYNGFNVDASEGAIVNINGGKFLPVHSGSLYGEGTINVMGGEFFDNPSARVAEGYKVVENETGTYNVVEGDPVAKIGDVEYTTLQKAFDAVDNGTIQLVGNVTLKSSVVLNEGKVATLDLNGKTITATDYAIENFGTLKINGNGTINGVVYCEATGNTTVENGTFNAPESGKYVFLNSQGGTLTINGGTINGGSSYPIYSYDANSSLVINDVTVNATFGCVNAYGTNGSVVINGGTYQMTGVQGKTSHIAYFSNVDATINGGTFKKTGDINMSAAGGGGICAIYGANLTINGGNFAGDYADVYNWSGTNANGRAVAISIKGGSYKFKPNAAFVAEGCEVTEANGVWNVRILPVAQIGDTEYDTLSEAFNVGGNITLLRNVTVAETVTLAEGKTAVLDLNGKTLSAVDMNTIKNNGGNLTIKNGTVTRTGDVVGYSVNNASGEIAVENATIERGLYTSGSKMTATNANISHDQSSRHAIYAWSCAVTINSGNFHNDNAGNATLMASGSSIVTINGGTFSIADGRSTLGWTSSMIDQNSTAQVIVKGGLFNGGFRINSADTTLTIEGGEFNTNNGSAFTDYSGTKVVKGGKFTDVGAQNWAKKYIAEGYEMNANGEVVAK